MKARSGTSGGERVGVDRKDELSPFPYPIVSHISYSYYS